MKKIAILGSTGSIGKQTIDVVLNNPDKFKITALTADTHSELLKKQADACHAGFLGLTGLKNSEIEGYNIQYGKDALLTACEYDDPDIVVLSVMGIAGLPAFEKCLREGRTIALANKEAMVCGGRVARDLMDSSGTQVLPVDSELSAIFQCLGANNKSDIEKIWLTASGGPLIDLSADEIFNAPRERVLKHPNWSMGQKITVDSASMVNKGLEIMETRWLFDIPPEKIEVAVHRSSIVHSMVEFTDGTVMAQMAVPDMRLPIQYALTYPDRITAPVKKLDLFEMGELKFERPNTDKFPCLNLCRQALNSHPLQVVLNAANEHAVSEYLAGKIKFGDIYTVLLSAMDKFSSSAVSTFDDILALDAEVRAYIKATYNT